VFLFPSWERPVVGNLSDIVGPNWELGPNRSATLTGSVGVMGVWEPKKLAWEARSQKNGWILVQKAAKKIAWEPAGTRPRDLPPLHVVY
jgi:hypothetical protein